MINNFPSILHNCPKLQKKGRKLIINQRKKVPLTKRNKFRREWKKDFISTTKNVNYFLHYISSSSDFQAMPFKRMIVGN